MVEHGEMSLPRRAGPRRVRHEDPRGTKAGTCLALTFRSSGAGAAPPVTRTRSQSQTKQQPAGDGRALLPFVPSGRELRTGGDGRIRARSSQQLPAPRVRPLLRFTRPLRQRRRLRASARCRWRLERARPYEAVRKDSLRDARRFRRPALSELRLGDQACRSAAAPARSAWRPAPRRARPRTPAPR